MEKTRGLDMTVVSGIVNARRGMRMKIEEKAGEGGQEAVGLWMARANKDFNVQNLCVACIM